MPSFSERWFSLVVGAGCAGAVACSAGGSETGPPDPLLVMASGGAGGAGDMSEPSGQSGKAAMLAPTSPENLFQPGDVPVSEELPSVGTRRRGLLARQVRCDNGASTTVSGTVYIPSGALPLYNVSVYVPDAELAPLTPGASCGCEITGEPIASALTDASGHFVLSNVPVGPDVPLVIQVGDWRREINIGSVEACKDTAIADQTLRLPARQSEGNLPKIAVATGRLDALECLVRKLGVAPEEFTNPGDGGQVQLFAGYGGTPRYASGMNAGADFPPTQALWHDADSLKGYDIVLLSCDGRRNNTDDKDAAALQGMFDYVNLGGRMFASHYQGVWFRQGPAPFPDLAQFTDKPAGAEFDLLSAEVDTSFPKGQAMNEWLANNGTSTAGQVEIRGAEHTIVIENKAYAQRWLASEVPESVQYISANTPLGAPEAKQCGRVVLSDIHVSPGETDPRTFEPIDDISDPSLAFPEGCVTSALTPQETVLAFMLFDLSACIVPDSQAPAAPIIH
jgi:hypothetical protein